MSERPADLVPHHVAEGAARRYLASRGQPPMAAHPLGRALPLLLREAAQQGRDARRDILLAAGLAVAGLLLIGTSLATPFPQDFRLAVLRLHLEGLAGLGAAIWAALLLEQGLLRLRRNRRLRHLLRNGAWPAAFRLAAGSPR